MNCAICKEQKIGPKTEPYGGFLCGNAHLQCLNCNSRTPGHCGLCRATTIFVKMTLNPAAESDNGCKPLQRNCRGDERQSSTFLPPSLGDEIEIQTISRSQEHLSKNKSNGEVSETLNLKDQQTVNTEKDLTLGVSNKEQCRDPRNPRFSEQLRKINEVPRNNTEVWTKCYEREKGNSNFPLSHGLGSMAVNENENNMRISVSDSQGCNNFRQTINGDAMNTNDNEDSDEHNIIHISKIPFMDSADSLCGQHRAASEQNHIPLPTQAPYAYVVAPKSGIQIESLSADVLREFDKQNTVQSSKIVEHYLETYSPLECYQSPSFYCQHHQQNQQPANPTEMKSKSVSTDSEPRLKPQKVEGNLSIKNRTHDYIVMHSTGVSRLRMDNMECMDKFGRPSLDTRMQKVLETLQENIKIKRSVKEPQSLPKKNFMKMASPGIETNMEPPKVYPMGNSREAQEETQHSSILRFLNSYHASCQTRDLGDLTFSPHQAMAQEPPPPQYKLIKSTPAVLEELKSGLGCKTLTACMGNIPRLPIKCPESTCQRMIFVSDFNKHLVVDHSHLPLERITAFQCKNFFIDPRLAYCGSSKCHALYLLRDKITDLGSSKYKDYLPLLVMTSRVSLSEICGVQAATWTSGQVEFLIIWVTGIVPEEFPIFVSLAVWSRSGKVPSGHMVYSGVMDSIRKSQQGLDVWKRGRMLMLTGPEVHVLTNGGKDMLKLQLEVH